MRLAASQRLWSPLEEKGLLPLFPSFGVEGVGLLRGRVAGAFGGDLEERRAARAVARTMRAHDIRVVALLDPARSLACAPWDEGGALMFADMEKAVAVAAAMEAPLVVLAHPSQRRYPPPALGTRAHDTWMSRLYALGACAEKAGIAVAIRPVPETSGALFWRTAEEVVDTIRECEAPGLLPMLDAGSLSRESRPRSTLAVYAGISPLFGANEAFGGALRASGGARHRAWAADLARLARTGRGPEWLLWDGDGPDTPRQTGPAMQRHVQAARALYGAALQAPPLHDGTL